MCFVCQLYLSIRVGGSGIYILLGVIWVLIFRMPSLASLSPLYKHKSRNVISVVESVYDRRVSHRGRRYCTVVIR